MSVFLVISGDKRTGQLMRRSETRERNEHGAKRRFSLFRFFRFRLRTLFVVVTVLGVFVVPELNRQFQQREAAKQLRSLPYTFLAYDYDLATQEDWNGHLPAIRSNVSGIARTITGSDLLNPVVRLFLSDASESSLNLVSRLPHLRWLQIGGSTGSLNDRNVDSIKPLVNCQQLEFLVIGTWLGLTPQGRDGFRGTGEILLPYDITEADLAEIGKLKNLRVLAMGGRFVTDESLLLLSELNSLEFLYLSRSNVTPAGILELQKKLPGAKIFELDDMTRNYAEEIQSRF